MDSLKFLKLDLLVLNNIIWILIDLRLKIKLILLSKFLFLTSQIFSESHGISFLNQSFLRLDKRVVSIGRFNRWCSVSTLDSVLSWVIAVDKITSYVIYGSVTLGVIIKFGGVRLESNILGFFFHVFLSHLLDESGFYFILLNSFVIKSHARVLSTGAGPCPFYLLTFIWFKLLLQRVWSIL